MIKKIVYVDMDNVLVDFKSTIERLDEETTKEYAGRLDEVPGIFSKMDPYPYAIQSVQKLATQYELFILSTAPWLNPSAWTDKIQWIQHYFGKGKSSLFYKRLIISHHKHLNTGDFLIDDREKNGAKEFRGQLIQFGSEEFPDWFSVTNYLLNPKG